LALLKWTTKRPRVLSKNRLSSLVFAMNSIIANA
jgi:hypothetical protein